MDIISIKDLYVKYRMAKKYALEGINLNIKLGESIGIIGPTGAGKSTLCACIAGLVPNLVKCDEFNGEVIVNGLNTKEKSVAEICQHVGIVFQDYESQLFRTTVLLEAAFGPENLGLNIEEIKERVENALKWTRLTGMEKKYTFALSGGQKQRLAIASVLSMLPSILVLDEATSDLDPIGKYEIYEIIKNLKKEKPITLIMVDHHLDRITEIVDRVIVLNNGKTIYDGKPREIFSKVDELIEMGLAPPQVTEFFHRMNYNKEYPINIQEAIMNTPSKWKVKPLIEKEVKKYSNIPAIEVIDVWHSYEPNIWALKNINLKIYDGEFIGLIGQNGSGKTTLAHLIAGIMSPTKGKIKLFGEDVTKQTILKRGRIVGYVFQNPDYQIFSNTVKEELEFGPLQLKLPREEIEKRVKHVMKVLNIEDIANEDPFFLNKANRQRVAVGSVLTLNPKIIILDEPTTGLSPGETRKIMELAKDLNNMGVTVITITHDMWVVAEYCERTIVLHQGEIKMNDSTRNVFSKIDELEKYFLKPPQITEYSIKKFGQPFLSVEEIISHINIEEDKNA
jgi:energy-coupling factor transport system ATP-binding protein